MPVGVEVLTPMDQPTDAEIEAGQAAVTGHMRPETVRAILTAANAVSPIHAALARWREAARLTDEYIAGGPSRAIAWRKGWALYDVAHPARAVEIRDDEGTVIVWADNYGATDSRDT